MKPRVAWSYARLAARLLRLVRHQNDPKHADVVKLKVFLTKRCNFSCIHCGIGAHPPDEANEISGEELRKLWQVNPGLQLLSFSGGEPFLRKDVHEIALDAVKTLPHLLTMSVNTNGWFTERILRFAEDVGTKLLSGQRLFLTVSSDGPEEIHRVIRANARSYEQKEQTLAELRRLQLRVPALQVRHNINVNPWNIDRIPAYLHELSAQGQAYFLSFYSASSHYDHEPEAYEQLKEFRRRLAEDDAWFDRLPKPSSFLGAWFLHLARKVYKRSKPYQPLPCFSLRASVILLPDGKLRPCINFPVDLGRIPDEGLSLNDLVSKEQAIRTRLAIREQRCANCWTPNEAYPTLMCHAVNPLVWPRDLLTPSHLRDMLD